MSCNVKTGAFVSQRFAPAFGSSTRQDRHGGRIELARQSPQESNKIKLFLRCKIQWFHQVRATRPVDASLIVMFDHLLEGGNRPIVHVWAPFCELAQAGRFVRMLHLDDVAYDVCATGMIV